MISKGSDGASMPSSIFYLDHAAAEERCSVVHRRLAEGEAATRYRLTNNLYFGTTAKQKSVRVASRIAK